MDIKELTQGVFNKDTFISATLSNPKEKGYYKKSAPTAVSGRADFLIVVIPVYQYWSRYVDLQSVPWQQNQSFQLNSDLEWHQYPELCLTKLFQLD